MPDDFAQDTFPPDGSKNEAIHAIGLRATHAQVSILEYFLDSFYQQAIARLAKGDDVTLRR